MNRSWPASAPVVKVTIQSGKSRLRGLQVRMIKSLLLLGSIIWFLLMFPGLAVFSYAQTTALNEWTWVGGSHSIPQLGNYGTLGVAAAGNLPGSRESSSTWVDKNGNLWLFGGLGYYFAGTTGSLPICRSSARNFESDTTSALGTIERCARRRYSAT